MLGSGAMHYRVKAIIVATTSLLYLAFLCGGRAVPDQELIQGKWKVVELSMGGKSIPKDALDKQSIVVEFTGTKMIMSNDREHRSFALHPDAKPKQIDIVNADEKPEMQLMMGIYDFPENDRLRICNYIGDPPNKRPTAFDSAGQQNLMVLVRAK
jgi:uncharacterized protein (TIGR03067 family)